MIITIFIYNYLNLDNHLIFTHIGCDMSTIPALFFCCFHLSLYFFVKGIPLSIMEVLDELPVYDPRYHGRSSHHRTDHLRDTCLYLRVK